MSVDITGIPALSIRQPWAWAILHAGKRIENREWRSCKYRGPVLIHASLWGGKGERLSVEAQTVAYDMLTMARDAKSPRVESGPITLRMLYEHRGGIVGRARIVGVVQEGLVVEGSATHPMPVTRDLTDTERAWWVGGFGLVLDDVEPLPFMPCKGALGLFRPQFDSLAPTAPGAR